MDFIGIKRKAFLNYLKSKCSDLQNVSSKYLDTTSTVNFS